MSGQIQTLATPPPVSVQTLLYNIYLAAASGGSGGASWATLKTYCDGLYASLSGSYANPSWIASLAWSKITGRPTTLEGYGVTNAGNDSTSGEYTGGGGIAGGITANGGDGFADESLMYAFAGGNAGGIDLSGSSADSGGAGNNGGGIDMQGGSDGPGGSLITSNGGGSINTTTGTIELGPVGQRTTIQAGTTGDVTINLPPADGSNGQYLKTDGSGNWSWASPSGSGDVVGPGSSTANRIAVFADTSGTLLDEKTLAEVLTEFGFTGFPVEIALACSDETTALTTGTAKVTVRVPYAFTVTGVFASVTTAPVGSKLIVDINEAGTSILSTKLSIDNGEKSSDTAVDPPVVSDTSIAAYAEITIDIDQIGSSTAGAGLKVWILGVRA